MSISSLPPECFNGILSFLNNSLYNCLFVNKYWLEMSAPFLWREPFGRQTRISHKIISTLLTYINENEARRLIPFKLYITNNEEPKKLAFNYGKFIRIIDHECFIQNIITSIKYSDDAAGTTGFNTGQSFHDFRVQALADVIYEIILRQGSNLKEFYLRLSNGFYIDLPEFSNLNTYEPGIKNLTTIEVIFESSNIDVRHLNSLKFLNQVSESCKSIVNYNLWTPKTNVPDEFLEVVLNIIKFQPLKRMIFYNSNVNDSTKRIICALEFRMETLEELTFIDLDFNNISLSFILEFKRLKRLNFKNCKGITSGEILSNNLHLEELNW